MLDIAIIIFRNPPVGIKLITSVLFLFWSLFEYYKYKPLSKSYHYLFIKIKKIAPRKCSQWEKEKEKAKASKSTQMSLKSCLINSRVL